ncbi:toll/interleukin-1 receptor domain-containing protein [Planococcus sp. NCCP-2050]|uniref:toll/interleukin-1 receptor domain-containing protein n=1 Tax=Planococcus sp. NCCP-2050 TaxID=2944679 RepID=UPI00203F2FDA|nr:toll/interleukin-1 receptor domain-containing protein [Planococcus sp. NCCP-2050]GKW46899.1 hypothetical protein NCCP2050_25910 [Planococcus sp. NCCP-2050]
MSQGSNTNPVVFISYTHDSEEHLDRVLAFSNRLRADGIDAVLDQYEESPPEGWPRWMDRQVRNADYVLMICTPLYFKRVMGEEIPGQGLGGIWESGLIYQHLYNEGGINNKFIPILFSEGSTHMDIPTPLQGATRYIADNDSSFDRLYWRLRGVPSTASRPPLGPLRPVEEKERKTMFYTSLIDIDLWNKAAWRGCAYLYTPDSSLPPAIALLFESENSAKKIAEQWKRDLTKEDVNVDFYDELRIAIIHTDLKGENAGYFVTVGTNLDGFIKRYEDLNIEVAHSDLFMAVSRIHFMSKSINSQHQQRFFKDYQKFGEYHIQIGYIKNQEIAFIDDFMLKKLMIEERHISDITEGDLDSTVLPLYQEMI